MGLLKGRNEITHGERPAQCLAWSECSINVSYLQGWSLGM